jgi:hypothetical protein
VEKKSKRTKAQPKVRQIDVFMTEMLTAAPKNESHAAIQPLLPGPGIGLPTKISGVFSANPSQIAISLLGKPVCVNVLCS